MKTKKSIFPATGKSVLASLLFLLVSLSATNSKAQCSADFRYAPTLNGIGFASHCYGVNNTTSYTWNFGDGNSLRVWDTITPVHHVYSYPGTFSVTLTINDSISCTASITKTINVSNAPCQAPVHFVTSRDTSLSLTMNAIPNYPNTITHATWYWGDGDSTHALFPSHSYSAAGHYVICVSILVSCGQTGSFCDSTTVYRMAQSADGSFITMNVLQPKPTGIKSIKWDQSIEVSLVPNPAAGQTSLKLNSTKAEIFKLTVSDITGKVLLARDIKTQPGSNSVILETESLKDGLYFVSLNNGTQSKNLRLVKN